MMTSVNFSGVEMHEKVVRLHLRWHTKGNKYIFSLVKSYLKVALHIISTFFSFVLPIVCKQTVSDKKSGKKEEEQPRLSAPATCSFRISLKQEA